MRQRLAPSAARTATSCCRAERPRQQQVGDVRARDEQHERDRRHQHEQRQTHAADGLFLERQHAERQPAVRRIEVGVLAAQPRRQRRPARLCACATVTPGFSVREDVVVLAVADLGGVGGERQRQDDFRVVGDAERRHHFARQRERRRQNADDLVRLAVERQRAADDVAVAAIAPHPGAVSRAAPCRSCPDGRRRRRTDRPSSGRAPSIGSRFDDTRIVPTRSGSPSPVRLALAPIAIATSSKLCCAVPDVEVLRGGKPVLGDAETGRRVPEDDLPIGVLVRQRPQQQRVRDAEDRGVGADANRERQDRDDGKSGGGEQRANRVAKVLRERAHAEKLTSRLSCPLCAAAARRRERPRRAPSPDRSDVPAPGAGSRGCLPRSRTRRSASHCRTRSR